MKKNKTITQSLFVNHEFFFFLVVWPFNKHKKKCTDLMDNDDALTLCFVEN